MEEKQFLQVTLILKQICDKFIYTHLLTGGVKL